MILPDNPVPGAAESDDDIPKGTVIHVEDSLPHDPLGIDPAQISLLQMIVEHRGEKIVRTGDRVEVTGEVQVQILHRDNLGISAACGASLDSEAGPETRLAERDDSLLPKQVQCVAETDRGRRLSLSGRRRIDGRHQNKLPVRPILHPVPKLAGKLRLVLSVELKLVLLDAIVFRHVPDSAKLRLLGDLDIRFHLFSSLLDV